MYHVAEIVRDAKRDMDERYTTEGRASYSTWAAYTPFPFLYALSGQVSKTMQRKAPDLVKRAAVLTRDQIADTMTSTQQSVHEWRVVTTKRGQFLFYSVKSTVETIWLPSPVEPIRSHLAVPVLNGVEGFVQFVTSEELPELYFVAKTSISRHVVLRTLVVPSLTAMEKLVRYMVILPTQFVFPSREEIESRTDLFLDESTSRVQSLVEYMYSATEVLDQHWSMVQWNILGRGPYESLSMERRQDVIRSIYQRLKIIDSRYKLYEFMASIKLQNEMLYGDVLKEYPETKGVPLEDAELDQNVLLKMELETQNQEAFPCWFYRKIELDSLDAVPTTTNNNNGSTSTNGTENVEQDQPTTNNYNNNNKAKWIEFPPHENRRLERHFRTYARYKASLLHTPSSGDCNRPPSIVVVDEGRHEVNLDTMEMTPVYWNPVEKIEVCRSMWLFAQRNYGLAPYNPSAAGVLEQAFTYYLAHADFEKQRVLAQIEAKQKRSRRSSRASTIVAPPCALNIPVEGHLVEFKGPHDMMQYKRLLAGTTPFTSKRRVYRGDPRIRTDPKTLELWKRATCVVDTDTTSGDLPPKHHEDDADIDQEIDHLVLIVHGIGDALKTIDIINVVTLRSIIDCAASLRNLHQEALRSSHFEKVVGEQATTTTKYPRTEFLPIEWHSKLHIDGLDTKIRDVTLPAIPKLREFANDTVLDVLFFMSPIFHRVILGHVANEMNRVFELFQSRNHGWQDPKYAKVKKVSIVAHSLGAIISFDVLNHQPPVQKRGREMPPFHGPRRHGDPIVESSDEEEEQEEEEAEEQEEEEEGEEPTRDDADGFEEMLIKQLRARSRSDSECLRNTKYSPNSKKKHEMLWPAPNGMKKKKTTATNGNSVLLVHPKKQLHATTTTTTASTPSVPATSPTSATSSSSMRHRRRRANGGASAISNGVSSSPQAQPSKPRKKKSLPPARRRKRPRRGTAGSSTGASTDTAPPMPTPATARSSPAAATASSTATQYHNPHDVPVLAFRVENLFCFGSPVGLFLNVRGQQITKDFTLPTCKRVFNIYHPYDPVAYRIEPILNPRRAHSKASIIRTFEGKLRFQYQIRNSFRRMWTKLRQWRRNFETQVEGAVRSVGLVENATPALGYSTAMATAASSAHPAVSEDDHGIATSAPAAAAGAAPLPPNHHRFQSTTEREDGEFGSGGGRYDVFGKLCQGLPIDYSLQENEIEITNEYLFALTSHVIYWGNRDASLFVAQKMILEPPLEDSSSDSENDEDDDDEDHVGIGAHDRHLLALELEMELNGRRAIHAGRRGGSISPAFSAFS